MNTPIISVIIPVYNAERYLASCIDSVLAQKGCDFEILLINDGSADHSLEICNDYASRDTRIRVFDKPNGGVSSARNLGLDNAVGEWITFLDSDDWFAPDTFKACLPHITNNEIVRFGIKALFDGGRTYCYHMPATSDRQQALHNVLGGYGFNGIGGFMFRRALAQQHNIRLRADITYSEDWLFVATLIYHCSAIRQLPEAHLYLYNRYNESSCTNTMTNNKLIQTLKVVDELERLVGEGHYTAELRRARCRRVGMLVKYCGFAEAARELVSARESVGIISLRDILLSDIHLSLRVRLLRLWFGHLRPLLRAPQG